MFRIIFMLEIIFFAYFQKKKGKRKPFGWKIQSVVRKTL